MQDFEKLGIFYLGKVINPTDQKIADTPLLYESKNLTTHAICIGMTGSGKTGLGISIVEETSLDKIPSILVDPKGDLTNLLLTFPDLSRNEFKPWVDPAEAERKGLSLDAFADTTAKTWREGLEKWGEDGNRIQRLKDSVEMAIYTPASKAGIPISILSSFHAPSQETLLDNTAMRELVMTTTSSLLGLLGINVDPIKSREHILISTLIDISWRNGKDVSIETLIQEVQKPPFKKIGALDIDTVFPAKERTALAINLNNLLASPGFQAWMEGTPLDIDSLLYTPEGKPKLSIITIAHLNDSERMFFVTLLLNQMVTWMRRQPGTSSLRALFYMDEVFGYFPPIAMTPSKTPLLTLLKQARAYGLGVVLATQNPVDLDYKGLSNCGTWFIGKLQTERDKARVIEGLSVASNGELNAQKLDKMMATIGSRIFMLRSIYEKEPILFETRWTMSYLRGPLTLAQIRSISQPHQERESTLNLEGTLTDKPFGKEEKASSNSKPSVPEGFAEYYISGGIHYAPMIAGRAKVHFVDTKANIDLWKDVNLAARLTENGKDALWSQGYDLMDLRGRLQDCPDPEGTFQDLPAAFMQGKSFDTISKSFATWLYQNFKYPLLQYAPLAMVSNPNEDENDFKHRIAIVLREKRDEAIKKLTDKYATKIASLESKLARTEDKVHAQQRQASMQKAEAWISAGATILGTLFGRGVTKGTITQAGSTMRKMAKVGKEGQDASNAENDRQALEANLQAIHNELDKEISSVAQVPDTSAIEISTINVPPRKNDITINEMAVLWVGRP